VFAGIRGQSPNEKTQHKKTSVSLRKLERRRRDGAPDAAASQRQERVRRHRFPHTSSKPIPAVGCSAPHAACLAKFLEKNLPSHNPRHIRLLIAAGGTCCALTSGHATIDAFPDSPRHGRGVASRSAVRETVRRRACVTQCGRERKLQGSWIIIVWQNQSGRNKILDGLTCWLRALRATSKALRACPSIFPQPSKP